MKQTIEIDVPDGYDIDNVLLRTSLMSDDNRDQFYRVQSKKKEPEYLEVRDYLAFDYKGIPVKLTLNTDELHLAGAIESDDRVFIRWIDKEPRRVEI